MYLAISVITILAPLPETQKQSDCVSIDMEASVAQGSFPLAPRITFLLRNEWPEHPSQSVLSNLTFIFLGKHHIIFYTVFKMASLHRFGHVCFKRFVYMMCVLGVCVCHSAHSKIRGPSWVSVLALLSTLVEIGSFLAFTSV